MLGDNNQNKMQTSQGKSGVCPVCRGQKTVDGRGGIKLTCHACRGTGVAKGTLQTK